MLKRPWLQHSIRMPTVSNLLRRSRESQRKLLESVDWLGFLYPTVIDWQSIFSRTSADASGLQIRPGIILHLAPSSSILHAHFGSIAISGILKCTIWLKSKSKWSQDKSVCSFSTVQSPSTLSTDFGHVCPRHVCVQWEGHISATRTRYRGGWQSVALALKLGET